MAMKRRTHEGAVGRQNGESAKAQHVALYMRVSSEDQAERGTIQAQRDFLRNFVQLYSLTVMDEYADDGITGTIPLSLRPDGQRLLTDAIAGRFGCVLVYRVDRLGRSLTALLEAHTVLDHAGVTIRSATEPFDTSTPIGTFLFQLLGSLAELEKSTITERMSLGRSRVVRDGKWTNGPLPLGYDLDAEGCLIPSYRMVEALGMTEADMVRDIFRRMAEGSTTVEECRRLNALGIAPIRRYAGGKESEGSAQWLPSRLNYMLRSQVYTGQHVFHGKFGDITREVPALIDLQTWEAACRQLTRNRSLPKHATRVYLLRALITCGTCGAKYVGTPSYSGRKGAWRSHYYRCGAQLGALRPDRQTRCTSKHVGALWLEDLVWQDCRQFILNPGEALALAQAQLEERLAQTTHKADEQRALQQALAEKAAERERVQVLFKRGRMTLEEAEREIDSLERETAEVRAMLSALQAQVDLVQIYETHYTNATAMLSSLHSRLADIEAKNDVATKRQVIELLVAGIRVETTGTGRQKRARVLITYTFVPHRVVDINISNRVRSRGKD
jgi:site-specific DNA recombinase